jgi:hypothetical protein
LEGNAPSNLGHELTTENTQMHEEWSRQHADDIAVYQGPTTNDALDSEIFHSSGLAPPSVAAAVTAAVPTPFPTTVPTNAAVPAECGIGLLKKAPSHLFFLMAPNALESGWLSLKRPEKAGERPF